MSNLSELYVYTQNTRVELLEYSFRHKLSPDTRVYDTLRYNGN